MPTNSDDVCLNKAAVIERAWRRVDEELAADPELESYTHIDAATLNIERACQAAIDLAMRVVALRHLGVPQNSADAFRLLLRAGLINEPTAKKMSAMIGFRNLAVHQYQNLDLGILRRIARNGKSDLATFCAELGLRIV